MKKSNNLLVNVFLVGIVLFFCLVLVSCIIFVLVPVLGGTAVTFLPFAAVNSTVDSSLPSFEVKVLSYKEDGKYKIVEIEGKNVGGKAGYVGNWTRFSYVYKPAGGEPDTTNPDTTLLPTYGEIEGIVSAAENIGNKMIEPGETFSGKIVFLYPGEKPKDMYVPVLAIFDSIGRKYIDVYRLDNY